MGFSQGIDSQQKKDFESWTIAVIGKGVNTTFFNRLGDKAEKM